jgi:enoyl-CoA hydratase/carnithine racemase
MAVTAEVKDRIGWITLDRPPANSYDPAFLEELDRCVGEVAEAEVAVAVIRSASDTFFSAGVDVAGLLERSPDENLAMCRRAHRVLGRFADESPLFVAAIAGHALGAGYELALAATSASPPRVNTASGCPTSRSACCPPPAAPSGCPAWSASAASNSAAGLAAGAPLAVAAITRVVNDGVERSLADALAATWRSWPTCSPPTTPARA